MVNLTHELLSVPLPSLLSLSPPWVSWMPRLRHKPPLRLARVVAAGAAPRAPADPATGPFTVTLVPPVHGKVQLTPALPADGKYPAGTVVTVTTTPDAGYALDSAWYSVPGRFGQMYHEGRRASSR